MERHDSEIWVDSRFGSWTRFVSASPAAEDSETSSQTGHWPMFSNQSHLPSDNAGGLDFSFPMQEQLTTTDDLREVTHCYGLGCNVYVVTPVEPDAFMKAIQQIGLCVSLLQVPDINGTN